MSWRRSRPANKTKGQFVRVDRFGNFFTNFGKNFLYQYNNPTRFSLYRMEENTPVEQAARKIEEAQRPENEAVRRELSKNNRIYNNHFFNEREMQLGAGRALRAYPGGAQTDGRHGKNCCRADSPA